MPRRTLKPSAHVLWPSKATEDYAHWSHMQSSLLSLSPYGMWLLRDVPHGAVPMHEKGLTTPPIQLCRTLEIQLQLSHMTQHMFTVIWAEGSDAENSRPLGNLTPKLVLHHESQFQQQTHGGRAVPITPVKSDVCGSHTLSMNEWSRSTCHHRPPENKSWAFTTCDQCVHRLVWTQLAQTVDTSRQTTWDVNPIAASCDEPLVQITAFHVVPWHADLWTVRTSSVSVPSRLKCHEKSW